MVTMVWVDGDKAAGVPPSKCIKLHKKHLDSEKVN